MSRQFEELDYRPTAIGALSLRRRHEPRVGRDVYEIKLGDEYLMSSLFTASEVALAHLGIDAVGGEKLDIAVGGLGLGYTAHAVLEHDNVASLIVIDLLDAVIEWHETGLLPLGSALSGDARCRLVQGDFFALAASDSGLDAASPGRQFDAILLDIDHSPDAHLDERSAEFYSPGGLGRLSRHLRPGGVFGLWSNDKPDAGFTDLLAGVFGKAWAEPIEFDNPMQGNRATQTVYLARTSAPAAGKA